MSVHVCSSTIDAVARRVDHQDGAAMIHHSYVRALEGRERLRLVRLHEVCRQLNLRGFECYPHRPHWSDEGYSFLVYRPQLLTLDFKVVGADNDMWNALAVVREQLQKAPSLQFPSGGSQLHRALKTLARAHRVTATPRTLTAA